MKNKYDQKFTELENEINIKLKNRIDKIVDDTNNDINNLNLEVIILKNGIKELSTKNEMLENKFENFEKGININIEEIKNEQKSFK